jgi:hypothetical protein
MATKRASLDRKNPWFQFKVRFWNHHPSINDCFGNSLTLEIKARTHNEALAKAQKKNKGLFRLHSIEREISRIGRFAWFLSHRPDGGRFVKSYILKEEEYDGKLKKIILHAQFLPGDVEPIAKEDRETIQDCLGFE